MFRSSFALAVLLLPSPLRADVISSEFAASAAHWQQGDVTTANDIAVGTTRIYSALQDGGLIFGNEITPDGKPDLSTRRLLGPGRLLGVAAIGDEFFVLSDTADRSTLTLRRVNDGREAQFAISATASPGVLRSDGTRLCYVYNHEPSVYGVMFDRNLNVVVPEFRVMTSGSIVSGQGAAMPGRFLVLLSDNPYPDHPFFPHDATLAYWMIDASGKVQPIDLQPPIGGTFASNGSDFLYVFTSKILVTAVWAQRYSPAGRPTSDLYPIALGDDRRTVGPASVAASGNDYFIGWDEATADSGTVLYVQRFGATATTPIAGGRSLTVTGMAGGSAGALVFWSDDGGDALMRRADTGDDPDPKLYVPPQQNLPSIASDGVTSMVAWSENDVRVARIARDGSALDGAGVVVSQSPARLTGAPHIVFNGSRYAVFWIADGSLVGRYVERDGRPAGDVFRITPAGTDATALSAAWAGERYLLAWRDIHYRLLFGTMELSGVLTIAPFSSFIIDFEVAAGPRLVAAEAEYGWLYLRFLDTGARFPIQPFSDGLPHHVHIVSNGSDYLVTATIARYVTETLRWENEVWAARFDVNGRRLGPPIFLTAITSAPVGQYSGKGRIGEGIPLFDGKHYRIVYAGGTLGEALLNDNPFSFSCPCFEHTDVPFDTSSIVQLSAAITAEGSVIAYDRAVTPPSEATHNRVFVRFARVPPPPRRRATGK
jgi:hypothetical protein